MSKRSEENMMKDELQVLEILEQHARETVDEIAKKCGFSRQKAWKIIKRLEEKEKIWGYGAITGPEEKNLKHFTLLVKRSSIPFDGDIRKEVLTDKIDNRITGLVKIENIYSTNGLSDFIFTFYAPDIRAAKQFANLLFGRHSNLIKETFLIETMVMIRKQGIKNPHLKNLVDYL